MYGCENWTLKKAESQRTDAFKLWCLGRLLRVPWTSRRSNQSILKEISPEYSLERLMLVSPTQWTWVWVSSGSWWWTGKPGMLQSMGSQRVGYEWLTWTDTCLFQMMKISKQLQNLNVTNISTSTKYIVIRTHCEAPPWVFNSCVYEKNKSCFTISLKICPLFEMRVSSHTS